MPNETLQLAGTLEAGAIALWATFFVFFIFIVAHKIQSRKQSLQQEKEDHQRWQNKIEKMKHHVQMDMEKAMGEQRAKLRFILHSIEAFTKEDMAKMSSSGLAYMYMNWNQDLKNIQPMESQVLRKKNSHHQQSSSSKRDSNGSSDVSSAFMMASHSSHHSDSSGSSSDCGSSSSDGGGGCD